MTLSQKLALRLSEVRQRLNEIAGLQSEQLTDEIRAESESLQTEYRDTDSQWRAAVIAEDATDGIPGESSVSDTGERREVDSLLDKVQLRTYAEDLRAGKERTEITELSDALELRSANEGGLVIPFELLEVRADDTTKVAANDGSIQQRPTLPRIFAPGIMQALGVSLESVPAGQAEFVLLTDGTDADTKDESVAIEADAAVFSTQILKPKRLTSRYKWSLEEGAHVAGIESVFRRDMSDSIANKMSDQVLNGTGAAGQVTGLLSRLAEPNAVNDTATFANYAAIPGSGVDGKHANTVADVTAVTTVEAYQHSGTVFQDDSGTSARAMLMQQLGMLTATALMAVRTKATKTNQSDFILHAGSRVGDSIAAVWPGIEVILDRVTGASKGEVALTAIMLWDAYTAFRADAYKRVTLKTG